MPNKAISQNSAENCSILNEQINEKLIDECNMLQKCHMSI